jgi:hypothetical protein
VAQWRWTEAIQDQRPIGNHQRHAPDQPLYLWFDLHGTQAAVDLMRAGRRASSCVGGAKAGRRPARPIS